MDHKSILEEFDRYMQNPKTRTYISIAVAIIAVVLTGAVILISNNRSYDSEREAAKNVAKKEQNDILAKVLKNNTKQISTTVGANSKTVEQTQSHSSHDVEEHTSFKEDVVQIDPITNFPIDNGNGDPTNPAAINIDEYPNLSRYNYRVTTVKTIPGPAKELCKFYTYVGDVEEISTTTEVFTPDYTYYKNDKRDVDGNSTGYFLSKYGRDINQTYAYAGGEYGVVSVYNTSWFSGSEAQEIASSPVSSPRDSAGIVNSYFGGDVELNRVITKDGKNFYEFIDEFNLDCNAVYGCGGGMTFVGNEVLEPRNLDVVNLYLVDGETFEIVSTEYYVDSVSPENLMFRKEGKVKTTMVNPSDVQDEFNFSFAASLRQLDYRNISYSNTEYVSRLKSYIDALNYRVLALDGSLVSLSYLDAKNIEPRVAGSNYQKDRAYYAPSALGDKAYAKVMEYYGPYNPLLTSGYTNANGGLTLHQFESTANRETLYSHSKSRYIDNSVAFEATLKINGETVIADGIEYRYRPYSPISNPVSNPVSSAQLTPFYDSSSLASYPVSYPKNEFAYISYTFIFEYNGTLYQLWSDERSVNVINSMDLHIIDTGVDSERDSLFNLLNTAYNI